MRSWGNGAFVFSLLCFCFFSCNRSIPEGSPELSVLELVDFSQLQKNIQNKLAAISDSGTLYLSNLNFCDTLQLVFKKPGFSKKWLEKLLRKKLLEKLCEFSLRSEEHGLVPSYYHHASIMRHKQGIESKKIAANNVVNYDSLALLMLYTADACLGLYHDLHCGRVDPGYHGSIDNLPRRIAGDMVALLIEDSTQIALEKAFPVFEPYVSLQRRFSKLLHYPSKLLGTQIVWIKKIAPGDTIDKVTMVAIVKKLRLHSYGTWPDSVVNKERIYKLDYSRAMAQFQMDHGLPMDGIITKETIVKLNWDKATMLVRLQATLDRWRALGPVQEETRVWANLAENKVYAWKQDTLKIEMKVCSGKNRDALYYSQLKNSNLKGSKAIPPDNLETPLLKAKITHFVVNPTWFVPRLIAVKEILPLVRNNPGMLAQYDYILRDLDGEEVNPFSVPWSSLSMHNFPYSIEQHSGDINSLGKVVIHFPNGLNIYMHDTPAKGVFYWNDRHVSHGCVRLEKPFEMIEYITSFSKKDNFDKVLIAAGMVPKHDKKLAKQYQTAKQDSVAFLKFESEENKYFRSEEIIPVYIVYFTSYVNDLGVVEFTADGYNRDKKLIAAMGKPRKKIIK